MDESPEGPLLVDASNVFECLNRSTALYTTSNWCTCPVLATFLHNAYRLTPLTNTALYRKWWRNHLRRRTQQVTHWFMASYALSTVPLISTLQAEHPERSEADLVVPTIQAEVTAPHMMGHHEQFWSILGMMSIKRPKPTLFSVNPEVCWASTRDLHWNSSTHYNWRSTLPWKHVGKTSIVEALFIAKWTYTHVVQNWRVLQLRFAQS